MIALSALGFDIAYEVIKFVIMILLIVLAVFLGKKLRDFTDARKAAKLALEEANKDDSQVESIDVENK